jgi:predicted ATPase
MFKCFKKLKLPLRPLTLLTGTNASGKSTVLQSLVLLHQTMRDNEWSHNLILNGSAIQLGTVLDVVDKVNGRFTFDIGLCNDQVNYAWSFTGERSDMSMPLESIAISDSSDSDLSSTLKYLMPSNYHSSLPSVLLDMTYLTAERIGPREIYALVDKKMILVVGPKGEFTASILHQMRDEPISKRLMIEKAVPTGLKQVEARMQTFFPGCGLSVIPIPQTNAVTLGILTSSDTDYHRPVNVGFGLTQILPIIVAALFAKPGGLLLIENPEVHLHPAGQAKMGQFLAEVANSGVQIILETHSDHILNGVRRAVKNKVIPADDVALHFFRSRTPILTPNDDQVVSPGDQVVSPQMDASGNIDHWPAGFFDQFDQDSSFFAGWGE